MLTALKVTFLFIGTSIGAGFSSGREIALFFGETSPFCVGLAGGCTAVLCVLFLIAGKLDLMPKNMTVQLGIFISACVSLCSMLAGGEYILNSLFGAPMLGLIMAIIGAVIVVLGIEKIKWANTVLIPLLIVIILVVYILDGAQVYGGTFSILKPIRYSGLDVLLGGVMLSREGKKLTYKQIITSSVCIGVIMFGLLFILQNVVLSDELHSSMPVLAVSESVGLKYACGVLIAIAIFTTLVSALEIVTCYTQEYTAKTKKLAVVGNPRNREVVVFGALLVAYPISFFGFENIVDTCYPFISMCGVLLVLWTAIKLITFLLKNRRKSERPKPSFLQKNVRPKTG